MVLTKINLSDKFNVRVCRGVLSRSIGLMFSSKNKRSICILANKKPVSYSLHMWFVFYPIDVFFLDSNKAVVGVKNRFLPFRFYSPKIKWMYAVESVSGTIDAKVGDYLLF